MNRLKLEFQKLYYNLDKILFLFFSLFIAIEYIWVPINSWISEHLLALTGYLYLSPNNIVSVFTRHWWVTAAFILLFVFNIMISYLQIGFLFSGVHQLLAQRPKTLSQFIKATWQEFLTVVWHISLGKAFFLLLYASILLPFLKRVLNVYYLNKLLVPQFIWDYLSNQYLLGGLILTLTGIFFLLASRLMYALPKIYFDHWSVRQAVKFSWQQTKKKTLISLFRLFFLIIQAVSIFLLFAFSAYFIQLLADDLPDSLSFIFAILNFVVMTFAYYISIAFFLVKFVSLLTDSHLPNYNKRLRRRFQLGILLFFAAIFAFNGFVYLSYPFQNLPLTISHRGVNNENGVQNTLQSLEKTSRLKPDFIEIDIQETADKQFVMMHDSNLFNLTGVDGTSHDFTLKQLKQMMVSENGHAAKMTSFDAYLARANQLGQKLLIEIKTSSRDSKNMTARFLKKYAKQIKNHKHHIHSLDYRVINDVKKYDKSLVAYFILPYNTIFPRTKANGYTMEYSSLDQNFMLKLLSNHKKVYAWTVNEEAAISRMLLMGVNGIITDNLTGLKKEIKNSQSDKNYASLLLSYLQGIFNLF
ncbi:glycerophosphodiester phosphodiesterase [Streptococcus macacae]|uniref:Membrane domain of glycerophosphoryl diester phosphodiesterase n=1 Tax=Streptococcus macacae NCTC 11558 TaxID=764298 RepID=G5JWN9_9STRE|nr:glycerophosphodiester phosphodiesterase [Streptococcus macacae]EHJ51701.1 membrane domain of glycerophosphoryl diester phosphodiesterase [Streptococcus macacae NCTC 11558]SUN78838.1 glycerophosphoryl diester phosphodiesterase family protein [Streptococcus macacae NCTC 11558]